jgi:hypothetical protein
MEIVFFSLKQGSSDAFSLAEVLCGAGTGASIF